MNICYINMYYYHIHHIHYYTYLVIHLLYECLNIVFFPVIVKM